MSKVNKPWCNYASHRTVSARKAAGRRGNKTGHGRSKRRDLINAYRWWYQALQG